MTPIQKKVFQMLQIFTRICDRLQLKYFLVCGSALGAVKYGGFVPWMMMSMLRYSEMIMNASARKLRLCFQNSFSFKTFNQILHFLLSTAS